MSRIRVDIDRLVLNGFEPLEGKELANALETQLQHVLGNPAMRGAVGSLRSMTNSGSHEWDVTR